MSAETKHTNITCPALLAAQAEIFNYAKKNMTIGTFDIAVAIIDEKNQRISSLEAQNKELREERAELGRLADRIGDDESCLEEFIDDYECTNGSEFKPAEKIQLYTITSEDKTT